MTLELDGQVIGCAGLRPLDVSGCPCWNLYYRLAPAIWGRGYAAEAAREAVKVAQTELPPRPVVARTRPSNHAAINVALRAGLTRLPEADADGFVVLSRGW